MDLGLQGRVALVTGGSQGLGRAISQALAADGAKVAVNYRRHQEEAERVCAQIGETYGVDSMAVYGDVSNEEDVGRLFDRAERQLGLVDILINNAAVCPTCQVKDMDYAQWVHTMRVNLDGVFLASREAVRRWLAAERPGRIVNVSSQAAFRGSTTGHAPYDASKGGIVSFTVSLAREVAERGIAVNAVAPGMMLTEMTTAAIKANEAKYLERIPLRRIGQPEEIAAVIVFLASPRASYMTGATVDVSGGMLMR
jgi:3-oxoacyl-[acyl-carrier protein] reductase